VSSETATPPRPRLLPHYRIRLEAGGEAGEDRLVFTSESRRVVVRGEWLQDFVEQVVPLLDGSRSLEAIVRESAEIFDAEDLRRTISMLVEQGLVVDAGDEAEDEEAVARLGPQLSYLHETIGDPALVLRDLAAARVTVVGLGSIGAVAAAALAAANVGHVRCVDDSDVSPADPHLAQLFELRDIGASRADVVRDKIEALNPAVSVDVRKGALSGEEVADAIEDSDFVLGCLDPGLAAITDALNRACLTQRVPWVHGTTSAFEGIVGPTVIPYETACYGCYQARAIATREDSPAALRELEAQYEAGRDMSAVRESTPFAAGIVGHLLALQAFQYLARLQPRTIGRVLVVDFLSSATSEHVVLRKPWCSACFTQDDP
jgi:bacteriocin biosynthesis cyclodehydratase domain-containing protein